MSLPASKRLDPWEYPNCPECEGHTYVREHIGSGDWWCERCEVKWDV